MYADQEEVWRCPKHPSSHRRSGVCPTCLRERLSNLCPDCASLRPCGCCASTTTTPSSSSSSSFSRLFHGGDSSGGVGSVGQVSNLIYSDPSFRRSSSAAVSLFRSRPRYANELDAACHDNGCRGSSGSRTSRATSFWGIFKRDKSRRSGGGFEESARCNGDERMRAEGGARETVERAAEEPSRRMLRKSRSVAMTWSRAAAGADARSSSSSSSGKGWSWYFPSPIKAFRQPKAAQECSPLFRS
ncbi:hypothetical protein SAY86_012989 [Trapa natans]|uniref:Uncharacterized protein n=1 Tax=Trapa natans TaxID=22666 RepID=A0AAN7MDS4_TRANT|nr:hypothetical protein SAY86_012989 [Trapa natans]